MKKHAGFPPLFDVNSKILVLGSFPSVRSRQQQFYYGNSQNRFWKMLNKAFGGNAQSVEEKKQLCLENKIALWDIVVSCEIQGSMDSDIKNYTLANLDEVLNCCKIEKILCNGAKAYQLTTSVYRGNVPVKKMPSTSPANVSYNESVWLEEFK